MLCVRRYHHPHFYREAESRIYCDLRNVLLLTRERAKIRTCTLLTQKLCFIFSFSLKQKTQTNTTHKTMPCRAALHPHISVQMKKRCCPPGEDGSEPVWEEEEAGPDFR